MANPLISQGILNLVKASISWASYPSLNITAPYLNRAGITLAKEGSATVQLPTMTGAVQSPQPYMLVNVSINLLKTQPFSALYQSQFQTSTVLGNCTVRPDVGSTAGITAGATIGGVSLSASIGSSNGLAPYNLVNCALDGVREQTYNGSDAGWVVSVHGYWLTNSALFN